MGENKIIEEIEKCIDCKNCLEVCDTYIVTNDLSKSPNGRLKIAQKVFNNNMISQEELTSLYTCTLCALCDLICPQIIQISEFIHSSKVKLVN